MDRKLSHAIRELLYDAEHAVMQKHNQASRTQENPPRRNYWQFLNIFVAIRDQVFVILIGNTQDRDNCRLEGILNLAELLRAPSTAARAQPARS